MKLTVSLKDKSYDLWIEKGALHQIGTWVDSLWDKRRIVVITDTTVKALYGDCVEKSLLEAGFDVSTVAVTPGEESKQFHVADELYTFLAQAGITRRDGVIALGGGVIGDLAGFVASTYMRGVAFLQVPTTLLAQVDSSVGGKTAINSAVAKNLIGTFAQPEGVLIDPTTLETLEPRRLREGLAEIVKSAAIADLDLWKLLQTFEDEFSVLSQSEQVIHACCDIKRRVVEADEYDTGERLVLNFGHTIGHAIEQTQGYGVVTHGEAVSLGMVQVSRRAEAEGLMPSGITSELQKMLETFHLPVLLPDWNEEQLFNALSHDKKTRGDTIKIILLNTIGEARIDTIPLTKMKEFLMP